MIDDLERLTKDLAICRDKTDANNIRHLVAVNRELVEALKEVREIYAGMEGFEPETAPEGYLQNIVEQMWKAAREALARAGDKK